MSIEQKQNTQNNVILFLGIWYLHLKLKISSQTKAHTVYVEQIVSICMGLLNTKKFCLFYIKI